MPNAPEDRWSADQFAAGLRGAATWLRAHAERLNALNVYPVPDGDTGTNMSMTLTAAAAALDPASTSVSDSAARAARAALMGSRGNSGVILSQVLAGFAEGIAGARELGIAELCAGLERASQAAYVSVVEPVEGTILTAIREAAEAVAARQPNLLLLADALRIAHDAARRSVERSPERLAPLREAGVVDAGAEGLRVILEALAAAASGHALDPAVIPGATRGVLTLARSAHLEGELGYCTEFLLRGATLDPAAARSRIAQLGSSVVVVAEADALRVHVHSQHPGLALEFALEHGWLDLVKVENMERQYRAHAARDSSRDSTTESLGAVAVAAGSGFIALFTELGAVVVDGGRTMNPSVSELVAALGAAPPGPLVLLPNNPNVMAAAKQAVEIAGRAVDLVPTRAPTEGIAALLALGPTASPAEAVARMREAVERVRTVEVARASRTASVDGVTVTVGSFLALLDGRAIAAHGDPIEAAMRGLRAADAGRFELVTLYVGERVAPELADRLRGRLSDELPSLSLEVVDGGQPHYPLMLALE